jgi:hypothetical protein
MQCSLLSLQSLSTHSLSHSFSVPFGSHSLSHVGATAWVGATGGDPEGGEDQGVGGEGGLRVGEGEAEGGGGDDQGVAGEGGGAVGEGEEEGGAGDDQGVGGGEGEVDIEELAVKVLEDFNRLEKHDLGKDTGERWVRADEVGRGREGREGEETDTHRKVKMQIPMYPLRAVTSEAHSKLKLQYKGWKEPGNKQKKRFHNQECEYCKAENKSGMNLGRAIRSSLYCYGCGPRNIGIEPTDWGVFLCDAHWDDWHNTYQIQHVDYGKLRVNIKVQVHPLPTPATPASLVSFFLFIATVLLDCNGYRCVPQL